jgi:hypothetical protein
MKIDKCYLAGLVLIKIFVTSQPFRCKILSLRCLNLSVYCLIENTLPFLTSMVGFSAKISRIYHNLLKNFYGICIA